MLISLRGENGLISDATGCQLRSTDNKVVRVEGRELIAAASGLARVVAECAGTKAETTVRVGQSNSDLSVSFVGNILSILTTKGCNSSACHGSPAGQAGFKLSLYASDPEADHAMILTAQDGRRVNRTDPEQSLLLRKPSFQTPHGGGELMKKMSDEYRTMLEWIRQGAQFGSSGGRLEKLEMYPADRVLLEDAPQPLVVLGRLSDGTTRDMTEEVRFAVDDEAVVSPVQDSAVQARKRGRTIVTARAMGLTATSQFLVVEGASGKNFPAPTEANFIDRHIFAKLQQVNVAPFPLSDDRTFVRRVYLDAIGVLPTPRETEAFLTDPRPDKRSRLIDSLLDRPEYATHWLAKFEDWFRNSQYYSQGRTNASYKRWLHDFLREDRPYDEAVREMLTAVGDTTVRPAGNFWHPAIDFMLKKFEVNKAVPTITRLFLGKRLECAECHNHPLENLTQDDFYGMAAFLARVQVKHGYGQYRRVWYTTRQGEIEHPVTKKPVPPRFLDGTEPEIPDGVDRRKVLADWITRTEKLQFARATVNRIWTEYFKTGIVDPPDDFRSTNRPTYPELLDELANYFIEHGYRFKALHRVLLNANAYQLAAHTEGRPGGTDPLEKLLFARYEPRKLPAEVLMDAVTQVTGVPFEFDGYPVGMSPKELVASIGAPYFLTTFGFPRRDVMEAREEGPSLAQALHLMNGEGIADKVTKEDNVLGELLTGPASDREIVEALYLRAFAKLPSEGQWSAIRHYLDQETGAGRSRRRALEGVLWAILNSKEFQLNQ